jgi:F-type H+-transporting ATPase subunit b
MPQLDITAFLPQIIWLIFSFFVLYVLMAKIALPRVGIILEQRQTRIDDNLDAAENLRKEANTDAVTYDNALIKARETARLIIYDATKKTTEDAALKQDELNERLSAELKVAENRINTAKENAISGIKEAATNIASEATKHLIGIKPNNSSLSKEISLALNQLTKENRK